MTALAAENVWKYYGDFPALRQISFAVPQGACLALLGRNGAGKTTLLRMLAGLSRPAQGTVRVFGADPRAPEARFRIGLLGHGLSLYEELSAVENLTLFGKFYYLADAQQRAERWLERVGLHTARHSLVREFSRGMRQRLAIARAFLHEPDVVLLDEPFTALDDKAAATLRSLLRENLERGRTLVISTHQLREALEMASQVLLLVRGRLAYFGEPTREMSQDPSWLYRYYEGGP